MNLRDERGLIGKALVVWLLILAIVVVSIIDFVSITTTRFHIADLASQAAQTGANVYRDAGPAHSEKAACAAAATSLATADSAIRMTNCMMDPTNGELTITVRKTAHTYAAARIGFLQKYTKVVDTETIGPSTL